MKHISVLGSTGSIGVNALEIIERFPDRLSVKGLTAHTNFRRLATQISKFKPDIVAVRDEYCAMRLEKLLKPGSTKPEIVFSDSGYTIVASYDKSDLVLNAIVGAAGLIPTLSAINAGKDIALANKEVLVMAGKIVMDEVNKNNINLIPVDSEHSAIYQCLQGNNKSDLKEILLTASGGPFLNTPLELFSKITVESALKHPNWYMGHKISIDSATLMNKALEVIEAKWLFDIPLEQIKVLIHPQSIIHSMVSYKDGSVISQMGIPDMRTAIAYALLFPHRLDIGVETPNFSEISNLSFENPDFDKFPFLRLASLVSNAGGTAPAIMNASNEVAVQAFLDGKIPFTKIYSIVSETINSCFSSGGFTIEDIISADKLARSKATDFIVNCYV